MILTFRISFLPKKNVKEQLQLKIKKHICFEANQGSDSPTLPLEKPKPQPSVNFDQNEFSTFYSLFKIDSNTAT